jgi:hypothetical protein
VLSQVPLEIAALQDVSGRLERLAVRLCDVSRLGLEHEAKRVDHILPRLLRGPALADGTGE